MKKGIWNNMRLYKRVASLLLLTTLIFSCFLSVKEVHAINGTLYYLGEGQQVKKDDNYKKDKEIKTSDPHYNWNLGKFCISGFSGNPQTYDGNLVILKNVKDEVSLSFLLEQDINALNGKDNIFISRDKEAYDEYFNIYKNDATDFGKGMLLVKKTDYQNNTTYQWYSDYLNGVEQGANTDIVLFEEGDYEVALDYQIRKNNINVGPVSTAPSYHHYQIKIAFSIRNSNCMVYPFDIKTNSELVNTSFTENGFYLDMAKSRYLDINIVKQNFIDNENTFETDTRFNKTASDGEEFKDEGIYIITVHNRYTTGGDTVKKIYVGTNPVLKAYVTTGYDIAYIKEVISQGAVIEDDGTITLPSNEVIEAEDEEVTDEALLEPSKETDEVEDTENLNDSNDLEEGDKKSNTLPIILIVILVVSVIVFVVFKKNDKRIIEEVNPDSEEVEDSEVINDTDEGGDNK